MLLNIYCKDALGGGGIISDVNTGFIDSFWSSNIIPSHPADPIMQKFETQ